MGYELRVTHYPLPVPALPYHRSTILLTLTSCRGAPRCQRSVDSSLGCGIVKVEEVLCSPSK
jgi:hypothetical protein